jgi:hypothetical protein
MLDTVRCSIQGFLKIKDKATGEILVDTHNDVLHANMSVILARALNGDTNNFLTYMAFGNGGAYIDISGILYKDSKGVTNTTYTQNEVLYNTIYVKKIKNESNGIISDTSYSGITPGTNYGDIDVTVTLDYSEPSFATISQAAIDNSSFVGFADGVTPTPDYTSGATNTLVFNEIGLFAGPTNIFVNNDTQSDLDVTTFTGSDAKTMLTHAIFHPVQKAANRSLEIIYTLRIQMGAM